MKFHTHIPKLRELALDNACDRFVAHGTAVMTREMPLPLYMDCIIAFAEKRINKLSPMQLFKRLRRGSVDLKLDLRHDIGAEILGHCVAISISLIGHVVLEQKTDDLTISALFNYIIANAYVEVEPVTEFIHYIASRLMMAGRSDLMVIMMCSAMKLHPTRSIRQILVQYGGVVPLPRDGGYQCACAFGMHSVIKEALDNGWVPDSTHLRHAIESGDVNTLRLLSSKSFVLERIGQLDVSEFDVPYCELLQSLGVIRRPSRYVLHNIRYNVVVGWFILHDMMDKAFTMYDTAVLALRHGGPFIDILHYLVDVHHYNIPFSCLKRVHMYSVSDLCLIRYVMEHCYNDMYNPWGDKEVAAEYIVLQAPLFARYWVETDVQRFMHGMQRYTSVHRYDMLSCLKHFIDDGDAVLLDMIIKVLHVNARDFDSDDGSELLVKAFKSDKSDVIECLVTHGARVNIDRRSWNNEIYHACNSGNVNFVNAVLRCTGDVNAGRSGWRSLLHEGCYRGDVRVIETLLKCGVQVNTTDSSGQTPLHLACLHTTPSLDIFKLLLDHGADVYAVDKNGYTSLDILQDRGHFHIITFIVDWWNC